MSSFEDLRRLDAPLAEKLRAYEASQRQGCPETASAYDAFVGRLEEGGAVDAAPRLGDVLPGFALPDAYGRIVSSRMLLERGPLVVSFNRGSWCSYCMLELTSLADAYPEIQNAGASVVSVMPDRAARTRSLCEAFNLPFPVLTDIDNGYALANGLMISLGPDLRNVMTDIDLGDVQGNTAGFIPVPATYVVAPDGRIIGGGADADFRRRVSIVSILEALTSLRNSPGP